MRCRLAPFKYTFEMGIRVTFELGAKDGLESILLIGMRDYREWLDKQSRLYPMDHDPIVLATADSILDEGRKAFEANCLEKAIEIDNLVNSFLGDYCDNGPGANLLKDISTGVIYVSNYYECVENFEPNSVPAVFWNYILKGRPIARDAEILPYNSNDSGLRVSFVTALEVESLRKTFKTMNYYGDRSASALIIAQNALEKAELEEVGLVITVA